MPARPSWPPPSSAPPSSTLLPFPFPPPSPCPVPTAFLPALDWLAMYLDALEDASPSFLHHHMPTFTTVDNKVLTLVESSLTTIVPSFACGGHFMCPDVVALNVVPSWSWSPELARAFTHAVDLAVLAAALILLSGFIWWIASVEEAKETVKLEWAIVPFSPSNAAAGRVEYNLLPLVKEALSRLRIFVLDIALPYSHLDEMTGALVLFRKESFGHLAPLPLNEVTGAMVLYKPAVEISPTTATPCEPAIPEENMPTRVQFLQASRVSERVRSRTAPASESPVAPAALPYLLDIPLYSFHLETAPSSSDMPSAAINPRRVSRDRTVTCNDASTTPANSSRSRSKTAPGHTFGIPASSNSTGCAILALPDLEMPSAPTAAPLPAVRQPSRPLFGNLVYQTARVEPQPRAYIPPSHVASNRLPPLAFAHTRPKIIGGEHFDLSFGLAAKQRRRNGVV
ncbi:hypothetical protein FB45DRAFT_1054652 [Roridomyces roridus]|uniref:Uncharacterized protein n=1 Tax=Roridomyces roridus TaxID=1738132 RepID=A0AAD7C3M5_9AGAR|nr:hypothetical protein FB45DRAFT_1054652 [Roridomyces roridus]